MAPNTNFIAELEQKIDSYGLQYVLQCIAVIANEKGTHVAENWQDKQLANKWHKAGQLTYTLSGKIEKLDL